MKYFRSETFLREDTQCRPATAAFATSYILIILSRKGPHTHNVICEDILMTCAVNSIFDCAGVLKCTPSNQIIEVCKQVAK